MNPFQLAKDLLFPRLCSSCLNTLELYEMHICVQCHFKLPKIGFDEPRLGQKFFGKIPVKKTYSFLQFTKNGLVQNILHDLKYKNKPDLAEYMGKWFGNELLSKGFDEEIDLLLAVPLHPIKEKRRGYNQADEIALGISLSLKLPFERGSIIRNKFTQSQTNKSRYGRFENVEAVFEVSKNVKIEGKRIALVDDVLTTGATLEVVGKELLKAGCLDLSILTIAAAL